MEKTRSIKVFYDENGNTLSVWFDEPNKEVVCEETEDEIILRKDRKGKVIGFEKLNFLPVRLRKKKPPVEVVVG